MASLYNQLLPQLYSNQYDVAEILKLCKCSLGEDKKQNYDCFRL